MKKIFFTLLSAAAVFAAVSCSKELVETEPSQNAQGTRTLTAFYQSTKTVLADDGVSPLWQEGDQILITDGSANETYTLTAADVLEGGTNATITTTLSGTVYAVCPASAFASISGSDVTVKIPETQDGTFAAANICVAKSESDYLSFRNATAVIKFTAKSTKITKIELPATGIAGNAVVSVGAALSTAAGSASKVTLAPTEAEGPYFMAVAPVTVPAGTEISFLNEDTPIGGSASSAERTFAINKIYNLGVAGPTGSLKGIFSVSETKKVIFAKGNVQFIAGDGTNEDPKWQFAANQYSAIKKTKGNTTAAASRSTQAAAIDLFGWGATGENEYGAEAYTVTKQNALYKTIETPDATEKLTIENKADWGYCFGGEKSAWYTTPRTEFAYIFNDRSCCSTVNGVENARFAASIIAEKYNGIILFPDTFTMPSDVTISVESINNFKIPRTSDKNYYTANPITLEQWASLEAAGCVFLPATGNSSTASSIANLTYGFYWCADAITATGSLSIAWNLTALTGDTARNRSQSCAVRLVSEVK